MKLRTSRPKSDYPTPAQDGCLRLMVVGSRDWTEMGPIRKHFLKTLAHFNIRDYTNVLVVTGDQRGVDTLIKELCVQELGIACAVFPAPWKFWHTLGRVRVAGPTRNFWMVRWCVPHAVLAFHPYLPNSKGTRNATEVARGNGVPWIKVVDK